MAVDKERLLVPLVPALVLSLDMLDVVEVPLLGPLEGGDETSCRRERVSETKRTCRLSPFGIQEGQNQTNAFRQRRKGATARHLGEP